MKKPILVRILAILVTVLSVAGISIASATQAQAFVQKTLTCTNPSNGYNVEVNIEYEWGLYVVPGGTGGWYVDFLGGRLDTTPNFQMDRLWIDLETTPNNYDGAIAHYGGTISTQNDVATGWNIPDKGRFYITDTRYDPAFRMLANGVGSGNSTYACSDYVSVNG